MWITFVRTSMIDVRKRFESEKKNIENIILFEIAGTQQSQCDIHFEIFLFLFVFLVLFIFINHPLMLKNSLSIGCQVSVRKFGSFLANQIYIYFLNFVYYHYESLIFFHDFWTYIPSFDYFLSLIEMKVLFIINVIFCLSASDYYVLSDFIFYLFFALILHII